MLPADLKEFLDWKVELYNRPSFIECDTVSIPHGYSLKEDIEISGFLAATIAWGNRKMILRNAGRMMEFMGESRISPINMLDYPDHLLHNLLNIA